MTEDKFAILTEKYRIPVPILPGLCMRIFCLALIVSINEDVFLTISKIPSVRGNVLYIFPPRSMNKTLLTGCLWS